ncbi:MAG: exosortase H [Candidatus Competibacteraceae bacterium]|nr:exosortase H [Candidatus Competibacteraceae bacterium]MCP5127728.1 exosortase H [Gammaproteobacteria bacterium]
MPLLIFALVLLGLFTIELMGPVQTHVIQPLTTAIAHVSAMVLQIFDPSVEAQGMVLRDTATGAAVNIQPGCNGVEALICVIAAMVATPASWKYRLISAGLGFAAIPAFRLKLSLWFSLEESPMCNEAQVPINRAVYEPA